MTASRSASPSAAPVRGMELSGHLEALRRPVPQGAYDALRAGFRRYGMLSAGQRTLPDFLIIGAKKAGTSSLMNWLVQHPAVMRLFPPVQRLKSPHYFDINYWRGPRWYRSHFPTVGERRRCARRIGSPVVTGEASPYYLFHPAAAARAATNVPAAKVIVLLRDPVSRAYSNYWDRRAFGTETLPTFEEAIAAEPGRLAGVDYERLAFDPHYYSPEHDHHSYLARGRYVEHLPQWIDSVPAAQLLILRAETMFGSPAETFAAVQRFLGIVEFDGLDFRRYNERAQPPMADATRARLAAYYRPYNAKLYDLLGEDLGWETRYPD